MPILPILRTISREMDQLPEPSAAQRRMEDRIIYQVSEIGSQERKKMGLYIQIVQMHEIRTHSQESSQKITEGTTKN